MRVCVWIFVAACGASVPPSKVMPLATPGPAAQIAARKDALCKRSDLVALAPPLLSGTTSASDGGVVRSVAVRDVDNHDVEISHEALAPVKVGAPLDLEAARDVSRRLWRTGKYDDIALETTRAGEAVDIVFRVVAKRTIANVFVSPDVADDATPLHLVAGSVYDPVALVSAQRSLVAAYRARGNLDATIALSSDFADETHAAIDVCLRVEPGPIVTLDAVEVHGSTYDAELLTVLEREDSQNVHGKPIDQDLLERDELVMSAWLFDRGLLTHKIEKKVERRGDAMNVRFDVTDGLIFRYGNLDVKGDLLGAKADYMKLVTLKRGDVFNRSAVMAVVAAIRGVHKTVGHDAEVEPVTNLDTVHGTVDVVISIDDASARAPATPALPVLPVRFSIVELAAGRGRAVKSGDTVSVEYKGMLKDGTVFDSSVGRAPFQFEVGKGNVIPGFDRGVTGLKIGGKRRVTIPPDLGYGSRGAPPQIPSNATLVFEIELVAIQ